MAPVWLYLERGSATLSSLMVKPSEQFDSPMDYASAMHHLLNLVDVERMAGATPPVEKYDLGRMEELVRRLGDPQHCAAVVHIAGTKGKGSVAAMAASILKASGLHVGLFTSPHLHTFRERIQLDGAPVTEETFSSALSRIWPHVQAMERESPHGGPSTFEVLNAMAFDLFRAEGVDVQVLEVGLGGRLDSTNVAKGAVAVITSLSLDHTAVLGPTLQHVATEKAGIIKQGARVVMAPQSPEAAAVVAEACRRQGAELWKLGDDVTWKPGRADLTGQELTVHTPRHTYELLLPLLGAHQQENAAAAVAAIEVADLGVAPEAVVHGIRDVRWPGRFQVLSMAPTVVVDGAHNPFSMQRLRETVQSYLSPRRTILVFGCSGDKDLDGMLSEIAPVVSMAIACASRHPRAVSPDGLQQAFRQAGMETEMAADVASALASARSQAADDDLILVTGSLFVVAEALEAWFGIEPEYYPELDQPNSTGSKRIPSSK